MDDPVAEHRRPSAPRIANREPLGPTTGHPRSGRLLLVGPRVIRPDDLGGSQVLFESVIAELNVRANVELAVVSTARPRARRGPLGKARLDALTLLRVLVQTWRRATRADLVVWFVSGRAAVLSGGLVWLVCRLRRRPLCVRLAGVSFETRLASAPAACRFVARRTLLRADLLAVETKLSAARLSALCATRWMPNTRNMPARRRAYRASCRRLLFLSLLQPGKGVPLLLAAAPRFPPGVELTICGPEMPGFDIADVERTPHTTYGGVIPPERVPAVMEDHDAVVLPTRFPEGYPGVVIEAFQMGLPVLVSRTASLQEMVTEGRNGLFVDPGSVDSFVAAVARLCTDDDLFRRLRAGALQSGEIYRSARAAAVFEDLCGRAAARRNAAARPT